MILRTIDFSYIAQSGARSANKRARALSLDIWVLSPHSFWALAAILSAPFWYPCSWSILLCGLNTQVRKRLPETGDSMHRLQSQLYWFDEHKSKKTVFAHIPASYIQFQRLVDHISSLPTLTRYPSWAKRSTKRFPIKQTSPDQCAERQADWTYFFSHCASLSSHFGQ